MRTTNTRRIPVYSPALTAADTEAVARAVEQGAIGAGGPNGQNPVERFERAWSERTAMPHAVAVSSGTAALELAVDAVGIGPGDEVVCPAFTIISCVRAIILSGATPVLADVDEKTWCIAADEIARRVGPRTRAVLAVHAFGTPYAHERVARSAAPGIPIIEDAAQAHGARAKVGTALVPCGGLGDVSIFSFYVNKPVTTGEGGMVLSRSRRVAERARDAANLFHGRRRFVHDELGHNYRMSGLAAALGLSQLARLDQTIAIKRKIGDLYRARLSKLDEVELQEVPDGDEPIPWMNALVLADSVPVDAAAVIAALERRGIETRPFFVGFHEQPALQKRGLFRNERYPVSERLARRGLYLPSGLDLDEDTVDHVVRELADALKELAAPRQFVPRELESPAERSPKADTVFGAAFAEAYDALYADKDYAAEVTLLERCFARFSTESVRRVLDVGCGTGRHADELRRRGFEVVGADRSPSMLAIARRRAPSIPFVEADMRELDLGETFDAVVILFAALSYQTTPDAILATLRSARRHLRDGGVLVADTWFGAPSERHGRTTTSERRAEANGVVWTRTGHLSRDPVEQRVTIAYCLAKTDAGGTTSARETHVMHYFSRFELDFALRNSGFRLLSLSTEGDLSRAPGAADLTALLVAAAT